MKGACSATRAALGESASGSGLGSVACFCPSCQLEPSNAIGVLKRQIASYLVVAAGRLSPYVGGRDTGGL